MAWEKGLVKCQVLNAPTC